MEKPNLYSALKNIEGMPNAQAGIFEYYRGNEYLERAIHREQSLEEACRELSAPFQGIKFYLPHFIDSAHNEKVERMGKLISVDGLHKRGIYYPDNLLTAVGCVAMALFAPMTLPTLKEYCNELVGIFVVGGLVTAGLGGVGMGVMSTTRRCVIPYLKSATYIDSVIKELEIK